VKGHEHKPAAERDGRRPPPEHGRRGVEEAALELQQGAGNRALTGLLAGSIPRPGSPEFDSRPGRPLEPDLRRTFELALGRDLKSVRVHTAREATARADAEDARAFTRGSDIYFNSGEYAPRTGPGRHLIAHELTHVLQQAYGPGAHASPQPVLEAEADAVAEGSRTEVAHAAPTGIVQRAEKAEDADASTEEKLRKLGITYGFRFGQGGKISLYRRPEAAPVAPAPKPPRAPRRPAPVAKPPPVAKPAPSPLPYADFDPTVPIPKEDEPVITSDDVSRIRAGTALALREATSFIERSKKGEHLHPAVMASAQTRLGTATHELQTRGDPAQDLAELNWELARIGGEYWLHRGTALLAAAGRGESVSPEDAWLIQLQLLGASRQSDDPKVEGAMQGLAIQLSGIRERALREKLELAGQGDPLGGRANRVAQTAQEAERQKQLLGLVEGEHASELQGLATELGVKRESALRTDLDLARQGKLSAERAKQVAEAVLGIERSKQLRGLVEGEQPSDLYLMAEEVYRRYHK
jgi:hypothetical protein